MRLVLFILFLLSGSTSFSQQSYNKDQINRLADAGKVWGYLKYYHPYLQYKNINMYENTQSHGEASVSWLKDAGAILIGNHTAGANGNSYNYFIPGGIRLAFSAYNTPMQGKGIQPDIWVIPTIKGIQQGKDEILERAIKFVETGK